jgi:hypothetical protein
VRRFLEERLLCLLRQSYKKSPLLVVMILSEVSFSNVKKRTVGKPCGIFNFQKIWKCGVSTRQKDNDENIQDLSACSHGKGE